jgi:hypothetical protein
MKIILLVCLILISFVSEGAWIASKLTKVPASGKAVVVKQLNGTAGIADSVKVWSLGNTKNIKHIWIAMHGDNPNFYDAQTKNDRTKLHQALMKKKQGAILIHPKAIAASKFGLTKYMGWADLWGRTTVEQARGDKDRSKYGLMIVKIFRQMEKLTGVHDLKLQTFSFSGSGRIDRAIHYYMTKYYYGYDPTNLDIRDFVEQHFYGMNAGDSMVNNSFKDGKNTPKPLVSSWAKFLKDFPKIKVDLIYDGSRKYAYMATMHEDIVREYTGSSWVSLPKYGKGMKKYGRSLRIWAGRSHMGAWVSQFDKVFLK